jgi:hypothetical protein
MPGKSFPLRHSRTAVPHLGLPPSPQEPQFWKPLMEKTSPIDLTQLPPESSERKDQAIKRLCGVFYLTGTLEDRWQISKHLMIDYLLIFTIHQIVSNNSILLFLTLPSPLGHCNSYL